MRKTIIRRIAKFFILGLILIPFFSLRAYDPQSAKVYLLANSDNVWVSMALASINSAPSSVDYIESLTLDSAIQYEAPIMAMAAANINPKNFHGQDFVAKLKAFSSTNQLGDISQLNDDIFGILALIGAGETKTDKILADAKNFLLQHQNSDGGWGWSTKASSDSNTTAAAIMALISLDFSSSQASIQSALNYLKSSQNDDGGFGYGPKNPAASSSDISSTAWAVMAFNSLQLSAISQIKNGHNPIEYLENSQNPAGFFDSQKTNFTPTQSAYAVIALSGKTLPLSIFSQGSSPQKYKFRIEGLNQTVCEGQAAGPTALDIVKNSAGECGFTYNIQDTQYGPYLNQINSDAAAGLTGWQYAVNYQSPNVGAADYQLKPNDEVLWYFGNFDDKLARLTLPALTLQSGQTATAAVEYLDDGAWTALSEAEIFYGSSSSKTDSQGKFHLALPDGYYKIFAQKTGFVRSNSSLLKVGEPANSSVSLNVTINPGQVAGDTAPPANNALGFSIDAFSLDFGSLKPGQEAEKNLKISNTGNVNLRLTGTVEGDDIFKDNLRLNSAFWQNFQTAISPSQNQTVAAKLNIPPNYQGGGGQKTGQLIFWASRQ